MACQWDAIISRAPRQDVPTGKPTYSTLFLLNLSSLSPLLASGSYKYHLLPTSSFYLFPSIYIFISHLYHHFILLMFYSIAFFSACSPRQPTACMRSYSLTSRRNLLPPMSMSLWLVSHRTCVLGTYSRYFGTVHLFKKITTKHG